MAERKTAKQKAQEDLDTAVRVLSRAKKRKERVDAENGTLVDKYERLAVEKRTEIADAAEAVKAAERRVEFLGTNPDLNDDEDDNETDDTLVL